MWFISSDAFWKKNCAYGYIMHSHFGNCHMFRFYKWGPWFETRPLRTTPDFQTNALNIKLDYLGYVLLVDMTVVLDCMLPPIGVTATSHKSIRKVFTDVFVHGNLFVFPFSKSITDFSRPLIGPWESSFCQKYYLFISAKKLERNTFYTFKNIKDAILFQFLQNTANKQYSNLSSHHVIW